MWSIGLPATATSVASAARQTSSKRRTSADRHQPRVVADAVAGLQPCRQPLRRRRLDQVLEREGLGVDLAADLDRVASVDEDRRLVGQHDRRAGRAGESGEPGEPLRRGRQVLALVLVGVRHDEAGQPDAFQFGAKLLQSVARHGFLPTNGSRRQNCSPWRRPPSEGGRRLHTDPASCRPFVHCTMMTVALRKTQG